MEAKLHHTPAPPVNPNELLEVAANPEMDKLYINGFTLGLTNADLVCVGKLNNQPQIVVNMSFTTAKTLVKQLNALILSLESSTEKDIMTSDVIDGAMLKMSGTKK